MPVCEQMGNPLVPESQSVPVGRDLVRKAGRPRGQQCICLVQGSPLAVILSPSDLSLLQGLSNLQNSHLSPLPIIFLCL